MNISHLNKLWHWEQRILWLFFWYEHAWISLFYEFSSWIILDIISHISKAKCFSIALGFWWISKKKFTNHLFWSTKSFLWTHWLIFRRKLSTRLLEGIKVSHQHWLFKDFTESVVVDFLSDRIRLISIKKSI